MLHKVGMGTPDIYRYTMCVCVVTNETVQIRSAQNLTTHTQTHTHNIYWHINMYVCTIHFYIYIYIYIFVCVCACLNETVQPPKQQQNTHIHFYIIVCIYIYILFDGDSSIDQTQTLTHDHDHHRHHHRQHHLSQLKQQCMCSTNQSLTWKSGPYPIRNVLSLFVLRLCVPPNQNSMVMQHPIKTARLRAISKENDTVTCTNQSE